jgi:hypothetical protein
MGLGYNQRKKAKAADKARIEAVDAAIACRRDMEYGGGKRERPHHSERSNDLISYRRTIDSN